MRIGPFNITLARRSSGMSIDVLLQRFEALNQTAAGVAVTPENCMRAPTVQAIVNAISKRIATLPVHVYRTETDSRGRTAKIRQRDHAVEKLLRAPNPWQTSVNFWLDATSWLVRYGNFYAWKGSGRSGPVRELRPLHPGSVEVSQDANDPTRITYKVRLANGEYREFPAQEILHVRGPARDGLAGDSPVKDIAEAIAIEIAAEKYGASVFGNHAQPGLIFEFDVTHQGFKSDEEQRQFLESFRQAYSGMNRFKAAVIPKGLKVGQQLTVDNEKAQFLATRQYQRTVIAAAWGVPPHMVGDLSKGTYNNVEQQSLEFVQQVVLPYVRMFEAAMERQLLTDEERDRGFIIRFNLDGALRGDFKTRQEGLKIMREAGVINPNEWREMENMNPISPEDGGETYWVRGPSGQTGPDEGPAEGEDDEARAA